MALPNKKDVEYQFYTRKLKAAGITISATAHLSDIERTYWAYATGSTRGQETATDLKWKWLKTLTGVTGKTLPDMWREAVVGIGQTPARGMSENELVYYTLAP